MTSKELILKEARGAFNRPYKLAQVSGGFRVISYDMNGARHSKMFADYKAALADFEQWTTPIEAISPAAWDSGDA